MNCRKARRRLPDFLNGRLSGAALWDMERHLEKCLSCRKEAEMLRAGMLALRTPETGGEMDFTEEEWKAAIRKATAARPEKRDERIAPASLRLRSAFGYGLAFLAVAAMVLVGVRKFPWLVPMVENRPAAIGEAADGQAGKIGPIEEAGNFFAESDVWVREDDVFSQPAVMTAANTPSSSQTAAGDVPSFTWISPETGLQIVWFVNDEIQLEE